ncbi:hypothetical protein [Hyphococcus sp.]|uniref:hypothetical protein n=1 Tax=Hyphococcus sp. TaxID=2038636 RepID=UPI0020829221|nr:MAG: hypothetical protein DHS20C04_31470 [Marinicaulis sp.]
MSGEKVKFDEAANSKTGRTNERSTVVFPYMDLDVAVEVANAIFNRGGINTCPLDELAAEMKQTVTSGNFKLKTSACRIFGLADKDGQSGIRLTDLGLRIVENDNTTEAMVRAFLNVPLYSEIYEQYRGRLLPPSKALEREMQRLGVASKQTDKARHSFHRSAKQAGFFQAGEDRLVKPRLEHSAPQTSSTSDETAPTAAPSVEAKRPSERFYGGGDGGGTLPPDIDPIIEGLLKRLPKAGSVWPESEREVWLDLLKGSFKLIYSQKEPTD